VLAETIGLAISQTGLFQPTGLYKKHTNWFGQNANLSLLHSNIWW